MSTWTDDKEQELFEAQETIAELLEALEDCHILIAMIAKDNPSKVCLNENGWKSAKLLAEEVTEAIRKASR